MQRTTCRATRLVGLVVAAFVSSLMSHVSCLAVDAAELKVGYVNVGKVFDGYVKTQRLDASLETKGKQKEAELKGRMDELKKLRQSLELLNDEAQEARAREIEEKTEELSQFRTHTARDLRRERDAIAKGLLDEIRKGLDEFAKANGFTLILDAQSLLYGQDAYDVTDEVLALLNGRVKPSP